MDNLWIAENAKIRNTIEEGFLGIIPMTALLLALELTLLYFLSRSLTTRLFAAIHRLSSNRPWAISMVSLILFPGTVVHELSHLFTAEVLGVRTGKLSLAPEVLRERGDIQVGSLMIAKTGPFRRAVIGLAPLFWGLAAYTMVASWLPVVWETLADLPVQQWPSSGPFYLLLLLLYLLFSISNTLFPSPQDMKGMPATLIAVGLLVAASYSVGIQFTLSGRAFVFAKTMFTNLLRSTSVVLLLNSIGLLLVSIPLRRKKH